MPKKMFLKISRINLHIIDEFFLQNKVTLNLNLLINFMVIYGIIVYDFCKLGCTYRLTKFSRTVNFLEDGSKILIFDK